MFGVGGFVEVPDLANLKEMIQQGEPYFKSIRKMRVPTHQSQHIRKRCYNKQWHVVTAALEVRLVEPL